MQPDFYGTNDLSKYGCVKFFSALIIFCLQNLDGKIFSAIYWSSGVRQCYCELQVFLYIYSNDSCSVTCCSLPMFTYLPIAECLFRFRAIFCSCLLKVLLHPPSIFFFKMMQIGNQTNSTGKLSKYVVLQYLNWHL